MKRSWHPDELIANFTLSPPDRIWLSGHTPAVQLGRATLLVCLHYEGQFPKHPREIPEPIVEYLAQQLDLPASEFAHYDWSGRRGQMDREAIRQRLGFRVIRREDYAPVASWLTNNPLLYQTHEMAHLRHAMLHHLREQGIEAPSANQLDRLIRTGLHEFERSLFRNMSQRLPAKAKLTLDSLLSTDALEDEYRRSDVAELKMDAGKLGVKSILQEAKRVYRLQQVDLSDELFTRLTPNIIEKYA